ncbi:MAG: efflux RND transporter periplasmic adaptor subunit [Robiginitomaculum sp.]|nr:efflux RND transporter periplasmic adaptor subunit [Robiginitomaculum sp.]
MLKTQKTTIIQASLLGLLLSTSVINTTIAAEIGALGYISPKDKIVFLVGTPGVEISAIKVEPRQRVTQNQILLEFSNHIELDTRKALAELELKNRKSLGPEQIKMQQAKISEVKNILERANKHLQNYQSLETKVQVATELSRREQNRDEAKHQLVLQEFRLQQVKRESELGISQAKLKLKLATNLLKKGKLVAPRDGIVLEIRKQVGETIGGGPTILLADDSAMYVICDVYESDLLKVEPGMRATVSSNSLPRDLQGVVERVNQVVDTASRLGKVLIKLNNTELASKLIGLEVHVVIQS